MKPSFVALLALAATPAYAFHTPRIEYEYAQIFDRDCSQQLKFQIPEKVGDEAYRSIPEFQIAWDKDGPTLMRTAFSIIGRGFYRHELTAYASACDFTPMSEPFLVNIRPFLKSLRPNPLPLIHLVEMTFHEFLHKYLVSIVDWRDLKMLGKYGKESGSVQAHLHLMALEKAVYEKLGRKDLLAVADTTYTKLIGGDYKKAWEIVNREGFKPFLDEVRKSPRR